MIEEIIQDYIEQGFGAIPLRITEKDLAGKTPAIPGYPSIRHNVVPKGFNGNIGCIIPKHIVIIDIDPRNFGQENTEKLLINKFPELKCGTYLVKTPSGGKHLYFKIPEGFGKFRKNIKELPGVDFLTEGMMAVMPGSINRRNNKSYDIARGSVKEIKEIPIALAELLEAKNIPNQNENTEPVTNKDPTNLVNFANKVKAKVFTKGTITKEAYQLACEGKDLGLSKDEIVSIFSTSINIPGASAPDPVKIYNLVDSVYKYGKKLAGVKIDNIPEIKGGKKQAEGLVLKWLGDPKTGAIKPCLSNTVNFFLDNTLNLELNDLVAFNEFTDQVVLLKKAPWHYEGQAFTFGQPWLDNDTLCSRHYLEQEKGYQTTTQEMWDCVRVVANNKRFHPVKIYLEKLNWDGVKRLDRWLHLYLGASDNEYGSFVGRKILIAAIMRIYKPGCKFDHMLVLESPEQGVGKSKTCEYLGGKYYASVGIKAHEKDVPLALLGKWIIEIPEMATIRKQDVEAIKAFISEPVDRIRKPYDRVSSDLPRQCVFIGTINPTKTGYLKDPTGNRRFWPVRVKRLNFKGIQEDVDQIWAEAYYECLRTKFTEDIEVKDHQIKDIIYDEVRKREVVDVWHDCIEWGLQSYQKIYFTVSDVYVDILKGQILNFKPFEQDRILIILENLKCTRYKDKFVNPYKIDLIKEAQEVEL